MSIAPLLVRQALSCLLGSVFSVSWAQAASWQGSLSMPATVEHDSNPRLEADQSEAVTRTTLTPDYRLERTSGLDVLSVGLGGQIQRSSDQRILADREDPRLNLGWQRETETGALGSSWRYEESSTLAALDETGVETSDGTRKKHALSGFWRTQANARSTLSNTLTYNTVSYDDTTLHDYEDLSLNFDIDYALTARWVPFTGFTVSRYIPADDSAEQASTNYKPVAGVRLALSETWDAELQAGHDVASSDEYEGGWQGGVSINYSGERALLSLGAERTTTTSGEGGFVEVEQLHGTWSYALSERSSAGLGATWRDSKGAQPNVFSQVDAWLSHELSSSWQTRLSVAYKQRSEDYVADASASVIGLTFIYSHPDI